jgi:serine/threonine protein kinase
MSDDSGRGTPADPREVPDADGTAFPRTDVNSPTVTGASPAPEQEVPAELATHARYRIVRRLGRGGMGDVYLAEHRLMERLAAIKVVQPELVANATLVERFHREVKAAAKLSHPNIVAAYDAEQAGSVHFLVMEYVEGVDLARVVEEHGPLPVLKACHFVRQAAIGLQHAFEKGMVHRDIKPQNLMLTPKGQVKILDFGIARFSREEIAPVTHCGNDDVALEPAGTRLTLSGSVVGTADYMAPEQARDACLADIRADIYSLGCTFYTLLTGQVPFPGGALVDKIMRHAESHWISPERLRPELAPEVVAVVNKMMAKNPARRYQTPADAAKALEGIIRAGVRPAAPATARQVMPAGGSRVAKTSTYRIAAEPERKTIDVSAILAAELPPLPPERQSSSRLRVGRGEKKRPTNAVRYLLVFGLVAACAIVIWAIAGH